MRTHFRLELMNGVTHCIIAETTYMAGQIREKLDNNRLVKIPYSNATVTVFMNQVVEYVETPLKDGQEIDCTPGYCSIR